MLKRELFIHNAGRVRGSGERPRRGDAPHLLGPPPVDCLRANKRTQLTALQR